MKQTLKHPLVLAWLVVLLYHLPGWWGGRMFAAEDVVAMFFTMKTRLWEMAQGHQSMNWWDRLPQLGAPALNNIQCGWFSPWTLWFVVLSPARAWATYGVLIDSALLAITFWSGRQLPLGRRASAVAALAWVSCSDVLLLTQDPCYKESLFAAALLFGAQFAWWRSGGRRYLALSALAVALHSGAGSPTAIFYDTVCFLVLLPALAWWRCASPRRVLTGLASCLAGLLLLAAPLLALKDGSSHSHRKLPGVESVELAESFNRSWQETALCFSAELSAWLRPVSKEGYPLGLQLSLAIVLLACLAGREPRARPLLLVCLLLALQSLGERGGLLWLMHRLVPGTLGVRAPARFFLLAGLGWCWLAAAGCQRWNRKESALAIWAALFPAVFQVGAIQALYSATIEAFAAPPMPPPGAGRLAVDPDSEPRPPLLWEGLPLTQGRAVLIYPETLLDARYALGMACSQWGAEGLQRLALGARGATRIPLNRPAAPLLRSWGLTWLLRGDGRSFGWQPIQPEPPRHWLARPVVERPERWAERLDWLPFAEAQVDEQLPSQAQGRLTVELDQPDRQVLSLNGQGLVVSADSFDPGWSCLVDGEPATPIRANLALKAVWIPRPGSHQIEWVYAPPWRWTALLLHLAGWAVLAATIGLSSRRPPAAKRL